jgi:hypothetical protein
MHSVIETSVFIRDATRAGLSDDERADIVDLIARNPMVGDLMPGTGGARKLRVAGRGKANREAIGSSPIMRRRMCRY